MGILRTDKISGLETPTAVTGSVVFDGTGDFLDLSSPDFAIGNADFTIETWYKLSSTPTNYYLFDLHTGGNAIRFQFYDGGSAGNVTTYWTTSTGTSYASSVNQFVELDRWYHMSMTRKGTTVYAFMDGILQGTFTVADSFAHTNLRIGCYGAGTSQVWDGHISNFRIIKGTALYTADFTPPVHALEPINGTVVLCCNNPDSARAASNAGIGTAHTITVTGDAAASTVSPGLTRDFTFGTQFEGVTTFDTQGYFVPPSGTTEQRGRGRGIFGGAYLTPQGANARIEYIETRSSGNGLDFGDMSSIAMMSTALTNSTRSVFAGGYSGGTISTIEFVTISTTSNTTNFGDLSESKRHMAACASNTKGVWAGGTTTGSTNATTTLDNVTIQSLGTAVDYGDLSAARRSHHGAGSPTRGVFAGGNTNTPTPNLGMQTIDYFTIASGGTALTFGTLTVGTREIGGSSDSTRAVFGGGYQVPANAITNTIEFVTIATTGNAQDFGDLTVARSYANVCSSSTRAIFAGGAISPLYSNVIDKVTIQSTGNATDFGDLIQQRLGYANAACDSHGGLS